MKSRINKKYDLGGFDTFAEVYQIDSRADDLDQTVILSAATATWIRYFQSRQLYTKDDQEAAADYTEIITRNAITATPGETLIRISGVDYEVKKVEQIGRRLHTKLWIYKK